MSGNKLIIRSGLLVSMEIPLDTLLAFTSLRSYASYNGL